jgi:hypothetical protein
MEDKQQVSVDKFREVFDGVGDQLLVEAPNFMSVDSYTTFKAEYAVLDGDIVFHFFANDEINRLPDPWHYWKTVFPRCLERVAEKYFAATYPRVRAAYTDELASWWLRANGFGHILNMDEFAKQFLERLDKELDTQMRPS